MYHVITGIVTVHTTKWPSIVTRYGAKPIPRTTATVRAQPALLPCEEHVCQHKSFSKYCTLFKGPDGQEWRPHSQEGFPQHRGPPPGGHNWGAPRGPAERGGRGTNPSLSVAHK